jgi:hypothetical protein
MDQTMVKSKRRDEIVRLVLTKMGKLDVKALSISEFQVKLVSDFSIDPSEAASAAVTVYARITTK